MDAEANVQAAARSRVARAPVVAAKPRERSFWIALACAAIAHVLLIAGSVGSLPRQMGEKGGSPEGVSVAMVDAADLKSRNTNAEHGGPASFVTPARPALPSPKDAVNSPKEPKPDTAPRPTDKQAPGLVPPPPEVTKQDEVSKEQKRESPAWPIDLQALESASPPFRTPKAREPDAASKNAAKPTEQPPARASPPLQLSLPEAPIMPGGHDPASTRPAGITRSGENDEFGRRVIRALRKTMPAMDPVRGRVTVRLLLSQDGNLVEVRLVRSSGNPVMDQSVMFAVRQSSFPFPPPNAPPVDRTFRVTYIYH